MSFRYYFFFLKTEKERKSLDFEGRRRYQEDAYRMRAHLCRPNGRGPDPSQLLFRSTIYKVMKRRWSDCPLEDPQEAVPKLSFLAQVCW